jgi:2-polyprenyl-6-methoxyphenol hydroxylase-like FAD-dependent oxidoreductase
VVTVAAFSTPEIAINPSELAETLRKCIAAHPLIEVRCNRTIVGAEEERDGIRVLTNGQDEPLPGPL